MTESSSIVDVLLKLVPLLVVLFSGLGGFLYWLLQRTLDSRFAERLAETTHQLRLEQERMSVVFAQQKDSFRKVLSAMHTAIRSIVQRIQGEGGDWFPITQKDADKFSSVASEETLLMDAGSDHAIVLFSRIMWTAVQYEMTRPTSDTVWHAHSQMTLIADRLAEHFRIRVGLRPATPDPLLDIQLLGACSLINRFSFPDFKLPTKGPLKLRENETAAELVSAAKEHRDELKSELRVLKKAMQESSSLFFEELTEIDRYLHTLDGMKSG